MLRIAPLRFTLLVALFAYVAGGSTAIAQDSSSNSGSAPNGIAPDAATEAAAQAESDQVIAAEAAIAASDWKTAEAKLDPWLAAHPDDARALFDAGYVADAQNRLDDAAALYRRAITANPKSFEAHLSLGLLLARQGKPDEARPELAAATTLDPGVAGPALKARAWRALAQIDRPEPGSSATPPQPPTICLKPSSSRPKPQPTPCSPQALPNRPASTTMPRPPTAAFWPKTQNPSPPTPAWPTC